MKRHCHLGNILIDIFLFLSNYPLNHLSTSFPGSSISFLSVLYSWYRHCHAEYRRKE